MLVGVSGGPDSMALLHLLNRLAAVLRIRLGVAHLNHCLRGAAADRDAEVVRREAAALRCPCHMGRAHVLKVKQRLGLSLEEAARRVRYAFFRKTMAEAGYNKLALGHHLDDNAEQMLMALLRGTGPRGLTGIAPVRQNRIVRPLIDARRSQIKAFVVKEGIPFVQDATNDDLRLTRNRIRHQLLPLLASAFNPRIEAHLNQLADLMRTEEAWIDTLVSAPYDKAVLNRRPDTLTLAADSLRQAHPALARRLVRKALQDLSGSLRRITFSHIQAVMHLLTDGSAEKEIHLPGGIHVRRSDNRLILRVTSAHRRLGAEPAVAPEAAAPTLIPAAFPASVRIRAMGIGMRFFPCRPNQLPRWNEVGRDRVYLDMDRLCLPLTVRPMLAGDRFTPLGVKGSQKLKKFFIDHRVARQERARTAVVADQRRIVWLVGHRIDDHVKVTTATTHVLGVEFFLLDTR